MCFSVCVITDEVGDGSCRASDDLNPPVFSDSPSDATDKKTCHHGDRTSDATSGRCGHNAHG